MSHLGQQTPEIMECGKWFSWFQRTLSNWLGGGGGWGNYRSALFLQFSENKIESTKLATTRVSRAVGSTIGEGKRSQPRNAAPLLFGVCNIIPRFIIKLIRDYGWGFTTWRFSTSIPIRPLPQKELYTIPIAITCGKPKLIKDGKQGEVIPGRYTVTLGDFELTEFDCLFVGDIASRYRVK